MTRRLVGLASAIAVALSPLALGTAARAETPPYQIRQNLVYARSFPQIRLVLSVLDASGKPVPGLTVPDIRVTEDGTPVRPEVQLASAVAPVALAFVLDGSGSMAGGPLQEAIAATVGMTGQLGQLDQAALITFREKVEVAQTLTADKAAVAAAAKGIVPDKAPLASWDAFNDALAAGAEVLHKATPDSRSAIVLVTDGFVLSSPPKNKDAAIAQARSAGFPIYAIAVGAQLDRPTFRSIADASGGVAFYAPSSAQLSGAYAALTEQILTQYSITYISPTAADHAGEGRAVELTIVRDGSVLGRASIAYSVPLSAIPAKPAVPPTAAPDAQAAPERAEPARAAAAPPPDDDARVIGVFGAMSSLFLFLALVDLVVRPAGKLRERLDSFVPQPVVRLEVGLELEPRVTRPLAERLLKPSLTFIGRRLALITPTGILAATATDLERAGSPLGLGPTEFIGLRAATTLIGGTVLAAAAVFFGGSTEAAALAGLTGVVLGLLIPGLALARAAKKRQKEILRVLPSTLDMIALSVEAGLAFDGAVAQVAHRRENALSHEFRRLLVEFQMGRQRRDALRELAQRCGVPEVTRFMNAVTQADSLGAPLSKALGDLADDLRQRRRQRAEELARTAPIKMLFPMIGLIFPALFVVILGPAVTRLMSLFASFGR